MAYVAPQTVAPGQVATASLWNQDVRDNVADLNSRMNLATQLDDDTETILANKTLLNANAATVLLLSPDAARDVWGIALPPRDPFAIYLVNITGNNATLKHESGSEATPSKRFFLPNSADLVLGPGEGTTVLHVTPPIGTRWVAVTQ